MKRALDRLVTQVYLLTEAADREKVTVGQLSRLAASLLADAAYMILVAGERLDEKLTELGAMNARLTDAVTRLEAALDGTEHEAPSTRRDDGREGRKASREGRGR